MRTSILLTLTLTSCQHGLSETIDVMFKNSVCRAATFNLRTFQLRCQIVE